MANRTYSSDNYRSQDYDRSSQSEQFADTSSRGQYDSEQRYDWDDGQMGDDGRQFGEYRERGGGYGGGYDQSSRNRGQSFASDRSRGAERNYDRSYNSDFGARGSYGFISNDRNGTSYSRSGYGNDRYDEGGRGGYQDSPRYGNRDRGMFERAGDEIASWFGDEDAARRREQDHRGRGPSNYTRSNERLLEHACERLTEDRGVDARNINVTCENNEVTLDGTVNTRWEKRRAEDVVHDISGVSHVQNNLRLAQTDMRADGNRMDSERTTQTVES